jgi:hypothetical protein
MSIDAWRPGTDAYPVIGFPGRSRRQPDTYVPSTPDRGEEWMADALCAGIGPDPFFPEDTGEAAEGKRICRKCPVQSECLDYALANNEQYGIWGGMSLKERRQARRTRADAA